MAQFDVRRLPGRSGLAVAFVVELQSRAFDHLRTRLVAPLLAAAAANAAGYPGASPRFLVDGKELLLDVLQMQPVPLERLGGKVGSPADDNHAVRIIRAVDDAISRA